MTRIWETTLCRSSVYRMRMIYKRASTMSISVSLIGIFWQSANLVLWILPPTWLSAYWMRWETVSTKVNVRMKIIFYESRIIIIIYFGRFEKYGAQMYQNCCYVTCAHLLDAFFTNYRKHSDKLHAWVLSLWATFSNFCFWYYGAIVFRIFMVNTETRINCFTLCHNKKSSQHYRS